MARTPPFSPEAERSVLGSMLLSESAFLEGIETLKESDFYLVEHRRIFRAMLRLFERRTNVDPITVADELEREGALEQIGGRAYISSLMDSVISPSLINDHATLVQEKSVYRKVIEVTEQILAEAYRGERPADELLDLAENRIFEIRQGRIRGEFVHVGEVGERVFRNIETISSGPGAVPGARTGFRDLDELTLGFRNGSMVVLASRPSVGKTSFMLNIHYHISCGEHAVPSAIFTLETGVEELVIRFLSMISRVDSRKIQTGRLSREDKAKLAEAVSVLKRAPIFLDATPSISLTEIRAKARRIVRDEGVRLISVDYMQLIRGPRSENRQIEVTMVSQSLKALAREMNIPILVLSQLSRSPEKREDATPRLSDLRESGSIEQDADIVMFLHRPVAYAQTSPAGNIIEVIVSKNRNGPVGKTRLTFLKECTRFESYAEEGFVDYSEFGEDLSF
ncbi:MAG: replicative DNA helicase [candidate division WOR-3 bacterium]